jgi:nucleoside-diphosphate-sugar epimerase
VCLTVNTKGTLNVLKLCSLAKIKNLIYFSTFNMINQSINNDQYTYDITHAPAYFGTKASAELLVKENPFQIPNIKIIRPTSVYSDLIPPKFISYLKNCLITKERPVLFNNGIFKSDYIHTDDLCSITRKITESSINGVFNIGSGVLTSNMEIFSTFSELTDLDKNKITIEKYPYFEGFSPINLHSISIFLDSTPRKLLDYIPNLIKI